MLSARQHLQRFPVLHTFHPDFDESVVALAAAGSGLWVAGHFVQDRDRPWSATSRRSDRRWPG